MSHTPPMSMRVAATAGSLALAVSAIAAPAVFAQDEGPVDAVNALVEAIEAKDFEALPALFCADFADEMGGLDIASMTEGMPPGVDAETLLDAFIIDVELQSTEVLSQTDSEAVVDMVGSMTMDINADALGPFIEALLGSMGEEVTPDMVDMFTGMMISEFESESTDISTQVTLVPGDAGGWLVCSDLSEGVGASDDTADDGSTTDEDPADAAASMEPTEGE